MKKLMFMAAAIAAGVAVADVTSANVVGYMDVVRPEVEGETGTQYQNFFSGSLFNNVGEEGYTLADLQITGPTTQANGRNNYIVFWMIGSSIKVDPARSYWWDPKNSTWRRRDGKTYLLDGTISAEEAKTIKFNAGEGFMCNFAQNSTKILFRGEVLKGDNGTKLRTITRPKNDEGNDYQNFVVANPSGRTIYLSEIVIAGPTTQANGRNNYIVKMMQGSSIKVDPARSYWWDPKNSTWRRRDGKTYLLDGTISAEEAKTIKVMEAGEGIMCNFAQGTTTLTLPTAL